MANRSTKKSTTFRLAPDVLDLLAQLAEKGDTSQAGWIEKTVREKAKRAGIEARTEMAEGAV